jgi:hypothetical protein
MRFLTAMHQALQCTHPVQVTRADTYRCTQQVVMTQAGCGLMHMSGSVAWLQSINKVAGHTSAVQDRVLCIDDCLPCLSCEGIIRSQSAAAANYAATLLDKLSMAFAVQPIHMVT